MRKVRTERCYDRLLVRNGYVVTVDRHRRIIPDGSVAVVDGVMTYVGPTRPGPQRAERVLEADEMLVIPGLIDGHHHPARYLAKGLLDDIWLADGMYRHLFPNEAAQTPIDTYYSAYSALGSLVEAVKTGTTCINDPGGPDPAATCRALKDVGLRGVVSATTLDMALGPPVDGGRSTTADAALRYNEQLFDSWNGQGEWEDPHLVLGTTSTCGV